jgi:adenylosuccinate lyase
VIGETLSEVLAKASSILPWMTVPNSQIHSSLSQCSDLLHEETQSLRAFRDENFLAKLERNVGEETHQQQQQQQQHEKDVDFELGEDGSLAYVSADKLVELVVTGRAAAYALDVPKVKATKKNNKIFVFEFCFV